MKVYGTNKSETFIKKLDTFISEIDEQDANEYLLKLKEVNNDILEVISESEKFFDAIKSEANFEEKFKLYSEYSKKVSDVIKKRNMTFLDNYLFRAKEKLKQKFEENRMPLPSSISFRIHNSNEILEISLEIDKNMKNLMSQYENSIKIL